MMFGRHYACSLGRFRISVTTDPRGAEAREVPNEIARLLALPDPQLTAGQRAKLREHFLLTAPELAAAREEDSRTAQTCGRSNDTGHARAPAGESAPDVHPQSRRIPATDGARRASGVFVSAAAAGEGEGRSAGLRALARVAGESADRARDGEPRSGRILSDADW